MFHFKKIIFILILLFFSGKSGFAQVSSKLLQQADSLLAEKQFRIARGLYDEVFGATKLFSPEAYRKRAYIAAKLGNKVEEQYFLNMYYEKVPSEVLIEKLDTSAKTNGWNGYELDDFNLFVLLYKQYSGYLIGILLLLCIYVFGVLFYKRTQNEYIPARQKIIFLFFLIGVALLVNLSNSYKQAIVKSSDAFLRTEPSAGADISAGISKGNRLKIINQTDIWYRVLYQKKLSYIRQSDVWVVQ